MYSDNCTCGDCALLRKLSAPRPGELSRDELIAYALAHATATLNLHPADDHALMELLIEYGTSDAVGVNIPRGDEYQRAVLHHFDPERVPDFPASVI